MLLGVTNHTFFIDDDLEVERATSPQKPLGAALTYSLAFIPLDNHGNILKLMVDHYGKVINGIVRA